MKTLALTALLLAAPAFANDASEYAYQLSQSKITLTEALAFAEAEAKGTAVSAELDTYRGKVVYEFEVLVDQKVFDVRISGIDGSVVTIKEDRD